MPVHDHLVIIAICENPDVTVDREVALAGAAAITTESRSAVRDILRNAGVVSDSGLSMAQFRRYFVDMSYVIMGKAWPSQPRERVCTCKWFCLYAHCEHLLWACGKDWPNFRGTRDHASMPEQRKRGRPPQIGSHAPDASNKKQRATAAAVRAVLNA